MKFDKKNGNVAFVDKTHEYFDITDPNKKYISVTTLIHKYTRPFDSDFWSKYKALERLIPKDSWQIEKKSLLSSKKFDKEILKIYNISETKFNKEQQNILDEWQKKNIESCRRGTKIHSMLENALYKAEKNVSLKKFGIGGKFECRKDYYELDLENGAYPEYLIYLEDGDFRLAGQVDLIVKQGNEITIADYKGLPLDTKIPTINGWSTIAELKEGDFIFDKDGNKTKILHKSEIHYNPCYKITFDNSSSIIADCEHRWLVSFKKNKCKKRPDGYEHVVMTSEEIYNYLKNNKKSETYYIPKILNPKPLNCEEKELPIDPYVLGAWLGDGSKAAGLVTQAKGSAVWDEIERRGYSLSSNDQHNPDRANVEMRTIYGLSTELRKLGLLNNKHIPDIYQRASFEQRLDLLRGFMDTDGYFHPKRKRFVMSTGQEWQKNDLVKLLATFGIKASVFKFLKKCNNKSFTVWDVCFSTDLFNPFLTRNQNIDSVGKMNCRTFRNIKKIELVETVPTQCLEVDSPSHTFLCTEEMIVTHNTNEKIDQKGGFDTVNRTTAKMLYPLNNLEDANFYHYTMQLSTYAYMLQKINPNFIIKDLILYHFDHNNKETMYHCDYLKDEVERMFSHYKKNMSLEQKRAKRKRIEY